MDVTKLKEAIEQWVEEGLDYEAIKQKVDARKPEKEVRTVLLEFADERLYHKELERDYRSKNYFQLLMGIALVGFAGYIAYVTRDEVFINANFKRIIQFIFLLIGLIGTWNIKEAWKKLCTPFEPPENFGYNRKKFQRF
ncbi:MAG TPA: hypothetical protein VJ953_14315 [Saprospiraceae bacterium]|nr:hypothetical protein [Saprospiraceae bacterium]